jgi:Ran GTPase-activating protein (RanGAP) involved in mRNA processing and transport
VCLFHSFFFLSFFSFHYSPRKLPRTGAAVFRSYSRARARDRRQGMALSKLSGDEQGIILGQLRNTLEPRLAMNFSSASTELRALLTPAVRQQLRADYEVAAALCVKMGLRSCKELREATHVDLSDKVLSEADDLATLGTLGSVLPALKSLILCDKSSGAAGPDGVLRLAEGLTAGALPAVTHLGIYNMHVGDAGASALAAALDRGALPRLKALWLNNADIGDAGLVALAPALRRRPALNHLYLIGNPFGDEGLAALVAPPPPAGALPLPTGGLKKLEVLDLDYTQVSDAGCAALAAALDSGALPALGHLMLDDIPASAAAKDAVREALARMWPAWQKLKDTKAKGPA